MLSRVARMVRVHEWSLVARIAATSVAIGLVFAGATTAIGYAKASAGLEQQGDARLQSDAVIVTTAVDAWITEHLEVAHTVAKLPVVVRYLEAGDSPSVEDTDLLFALGASFKSSFHDSSSGFSLYDANGVMRVSQTAAAIGQSYAHRDYFQNAIRGRDFISGVSRKLSDGSTTIFIATPVKAADGRVIGVVNSSGDVDGLQKLVQAEHQRSGETARGLLLDERGLIIANTVDPSWILRPTVPLSPDFIQAAELDKRWGKLPTPGPLGEQGLTPAIGATDRTIFDWTSQGTAYHAVAMPLHSTHWSYVTALPAATFKAATQDLLRTAALAVAIGLLFAIGLTLLVTRPLARGLRLLTASAGRLAQGDVEQDDYATTRDEIGQMAAAFNDVRAYLGNFAATATRMADGDLSLEVEPASERDSLGLAFNRMRTRLRDLVGEVQAAASDVAETSITVRASAVETGTSVQSVSQAIQHVAGGARDTSRNVQETNIAVTQLSQAIDGIARGAADQALQIQAASATANQMASGVQEVARRADSVAAASQQTKTSAQHGAEAVRETIWGMGEIKAVVVEAANKVNELGKLGEQIGLVVETIDDIAEQTNLLALNAAIEAARAGEHGRGFAVVADEVRKLAERSSRETRQIADLIRAVQVATDHAVSAMQGGATRVEQGSARADLAGRALGEILAAVDGTVQQVGEIAESAQQMAASSRSVVEAMEAISAVVEENTASTEEMAAQATQVRGAIQNIAGVSSQQSVAADEVSASTEQMTGQVAHVTSRAEELSATAQHLRNLVARFKLEDEASEPEDIVPLRRAA